MQAFCAAPRTACHAAFARRARPRACPQTHPRAVALASGTHATGAGASIPDSTATDQRVKNPAGRRAGKRALRQLAAAGAWRKLVGCVEERLTEDGVDERLVAFAASLAADSGESVVVDALFARMRARGVKPGAHSYSVMLKSLTRARVDPDAVDALVSELTAAGVALDNVLLNSIAHAYIRAKALNKAQNFVTSPKRAHLRDARTFNILIRGHAVAGDIDQAFDVRDEMFAAGVQPNDVTRNILIDTCARAGDYERAWAIASELSSTSDRAKDAMDPMCLAVTSVLVSHAEAGRIDMARGLLEGMEARHVAPNGVTYAALIRACLRRDEVDAAEAIFASAPAKVQSDVKVCNALVSGLSRTYKTESLHRAFTFVQKMQSSSTKPNEETYNELVDGFMRSGLFARAEQIIKLMRHNGVVPTVVSYSILMRGYGARGQSINARRVFSRMMEDGVRPDGIALNTLIVASCRGGELEFASKLLKGMEQETGVRKATCSSYSPLISAYSRQRNFDAAWNVYEKMKENGIQPNIYVSTLMANTVHVLGRYIVNDGRIRQRQLLAKRCCELLQDGVNTGHDMRTLRKWRRQMLTMFGYKKQLVRELEKLKLGVDVTSASERIFENHGWNEIDSGWRVL